MTHCTWTRATAYTWRKACGGNVILFAGHPQDHTCTCGKAAISTEGKE